MSTQEENIERVREKIAWLIVGFCAAHTEQLFHMESLVQHVQAAMPFVAPDSSSRILRLLRQEGRINYVVVSRSNSLYHVLPLGASREGVEPPDEPVDYSRVCWGEDPNEDEP